MDYSRLIAITNHNLYQGTDYLSKLRTVVRLHPYAMILRDKDLQESEYRLLAESLIPYCRQEGVLLFIHSRIDLAMELGCRNIHLSIHGLTRLAEADASVRNHFDRISVSCHSYEDLQLAEQMQASQIILGTIFETDCKKGLKGKGTEFVREIAESTSIPVYAIGGIKMSNLKQVIDAGAAGGCMMSGFMCDSL